MNWYLDVFANDCADESSSTLAAIQRCLDTDRSGPCEDDCEVTAPYVDLLPNESGKEHGSPLDFRDKAYYPPGVKFVYPCSFGDD
jgi:hypothetical protein